LDLRPSRLLAGILVLAHCLALAAAWVGLGAWARYLAWAGILASLGGCLAQLRRLPASLELHEDGRAVWLTREGERRQGGLGRSNFVSAALVILELESGGKGRNWVVLMQDSASVEDFRRLKVWLRWRRSALQPEVKE
jgi:membrane-bound toxin of toxin-antitoxin system